jgi:serine protease Do
VTNTTQMTRRAAIPVLLALALAGAACSNGNGGPLQPTTSATTSLAVSSSGGSPLQTAPPPSIDPGAEPVVQVVKRVQPAVVNVVTNLFQQTPFGEQRERGVGTGFIVRSNGIIVTNFHVVEGASHITVIVGISPNVRRFTGRVIGGDQQADLAVLKIDGDNLPTVTIGDSGTLELGEPVVALGYALALQGGPTVTSGIVSALNRVVRANDPNFRARTYTHVIQTDAAINPGNSGGPLVNLAGQVVGINTAGAQQAENIGFAIAVNAAKPTIDETIAHPSAPVAFLGVTTQDVNRDLQFQLNLPVDHGAFVVNVVPKGPAQAAGIRRGQVIVSFDGKPVNGSDDLGSLIQEHKPGDRATVGVVLPDGTERSFTATLTVRPLPVATP